MRTGAAVTIEVVRTPVADAGTSGRALTAASEPAVPAGHRARSTRGGPDRLSIVLFSAALFLILLALLAHQLRSASLAKTPRYTLVRKVYRTRVIETIIGPGPVSVSQSVASSGSLSAAPALSTRTS